METELNLSSSINMNQNNHDSNVTDLVDEDDSDVPRVRRGGRRKIDIEYIKDKSRRHITFSKRKAGIMKKAYELSTLTGTQVLLLVVSETGLVYTFTTPKLQPMVTNTEGKNLIQNCLNAPDEDKEDEGRSATSEPEPEPQSNHHHLAPSNTNSNPDDNPTKRIVHNESTPVTTSILPNPNSGYPQVSYGLPPPSDQQQQQQPQPQPTLDNNHPHPVNYHHPNGTTPYPPPNPIPMSHPPLNPHITYPAPPHNGAYSNLYVAGSTTTPDQPNLPPTGTTSHYPNHSGYVNHPYPVPHHQPTTTTPYQPNSYPPPPPGVHPYYPTQPSHPYPPPTASTTPYPPPHSGVHPYNPSHPYPPPPTTTSQNPQPHFHSYPPPPTIHQPNPIHQPTTTHPDPNSITNPYSTHPSY